MDKVKVNELEVFTNVHIVNNNDDVLLLSHGATSHGGSFGGVLKFLENKNYIVLDLPSHFRTGGNHLKELNKMVDFMEEFINVVKEKYSLNGQKFVFLGHSMSGPIALELGYRKNKNIKGLILLTTTANFKDVISEDLLESFNGKDNLEFYKLGFSNKTSSKTYDFLLTALHLVSNETKYLDFKMLKNYDTRNKLNEIEIPTLIIEASDDYIIKSEHQKDLIKGIKINKHIVLDNCGHFCISENPKLIAEEVSEFIESI